MEFGARGMWIRYSLAILLLAVPASSALAATIWTGPMISFSKAAFADPSLSVNQDHITNAVWITRANFSGIFNTVTEPGFQRFSSPADTEWAWDLAGFNSGLEISATNYQALEFNLWRSAFGGNLSGGPRTTVGVPGVLHLISEDIYLDITFTSWGLAGGGGGLFSYERSTVPEPSTALLLCIGLIGLATTRQQRRRPSGA